MLERHGEEEHELRKTHVQQQTESYKGLMEDAQAAQVKELEARQDR